jgi:DNA polymerase-1
MAVQGVVTPDNKGITDFSPLGSTGEGLMGLARLFLIDAHALCYRSFYAIRDLSTSRGQATNAVFGFVNTLRKILREYQPEYMAVCFDSPQRTHRQQKFAQYKIQRPKMPDDLIDQVPLIKEVVRTYNLAVFECAGFEADDLIATIAHRVEDKDIDVVVVSEDKDMFQLAQAHVAFFSVRKDAILGYEDVKGLLGFDPRQTPDFIALAGDTADNIPGVDGIGKVTARNLINVYGSLEDIFKNLDTVSPPAVKEKLFRHKETAVLSKELAVLDRNAPIEFHLNDLSVRSSDSKRLFEIFRDLEFTKFAREIMPPEECPVPVLAEELRSEEAIDIVVAAIRKVGQAAFLVHCPEGADARMIMAVDADKVFFVSINKCGSLKEILAQEDILKITYNMKEAMKLLQAHDCVLRGKVFDVFLAGYLLGAGQGGLTLSALAWAYLKETLPQPEDVPTHVQYVARLYPVMAEALREGSLTALFEQIEMPLAYVLADMEACGVRIDVGLLQELSEECRRKIEDLTARLYRVAGEEFNLNSPKQLGHILFEKLSLPVIKRTKTGFSTDEEVLTVLARTHDFAGLILEYRQLSKLKSTYIDALPKLINPHTGRIHAQFNQTGAETGRLSSSQPNLQNIPIRTELGRQIRKAIIPLEDGHEIVAADYSQIELRILAHLSRDPNLTRAFEEDEDIHTFTASLIFDVKEDQVTDHMRDLAKRVNFGIIYGMSAFGLAKDLGAPQDKAQEFIDKYFLRYPKVQTFMEETIRQCERDGFVTTLLNRRRYIPEINSRNNSMRMFAQRQAINTPVQGSAADLMKLAMVHIHEKIQKQHLKSKMISTVHDEIVFDVPQEEKGAVVKMIRREMEHALELSVPVKVSVKAGVNWLEMEEVIA